LLYAFLTLLYTPIKKFVKIKKLKSKMKHPKDTVGGKVVKTETASSKALSTQRR
jgi:hypothetical protein